MGSGLKFSEDSNSEISDDSTPIANRIKIIEMTETKESTISLAKGIPEFPNDLITEEELNTFSKFLKNLKSKTRITPSTPSIAKYEEESPEKSTTSMGQLDANLVVQQLIDINLILLNEVEKLNQDLRENHRDLVELHEATIVEKRKLRKELEELRHEISIRFSPVTSKDFDYYSENLDKDY